MTSKQSSESWFMHSSIGDMDLNEYCLRAPTAEIRLLDFLPPATSGNLKCRVRRASIDDTPTFISVSHVWGSGKAERLMHLESWCGTKVIQISKNLESLLVRLLCHDSNTLPQLWDGSSRLPMWIDMICINQNDMDEKRSQIPLMREIYSQARSVIIWINEYDSYLRYAFHYLRRMVEDSPNTEGSNRWTLFDNNGWNAIQRLLDCEWFHRRWVVQEAVISKDVVFLCGPDVMTMDDLFRGIDLVLTAMLARPKKVKKIQIAHAGSARPALVLRALKESHAQEQQMSLLWLLENLRLTRSTFAHDQIYALLGLCSPEEVAGNPIRYDLEAEEVYKICAISHAKLHNDLEFLGLCTPAQRDILSPGPSMDMKSRPFAGPSWVPNWHSKHLCRCLGLSKLDIGHKYFDASSALPVDPAFISNQLVTSGILVDRIHVLGNFCHPDRYHEQSDANSKLFQQYFDFWNMSVNDIMPYRDEASRAETFARTISLLGVYLHPQPSPHDIPGMFYRWCSGTTLGKQLEQQGLGRKRESQENSKQSFIRMKRLMSWEPFVTKQGYIGLAREHCRVGDEVWIIGGCSVPILLSPKIENPSHYEVRGEVFLDGFMFGEIMGTELRGSRSIERITLI